MQQYILSFNGGIVVEGKRDQENPALDLIIAAVIMSVLMVLTALQEKPQKVWGKDSSLYKWDTGWYCDADGGGEEICKVPSRIKSSSGAVVLRQDIPEFLEEEKYLGFLNHYQQAEVILTVSADTSI